MIQIGYLKDWTTDEGEKKVFFKAVKGLYYKSLKELFDNVDKDLDKFVKPEDRVNLFYTVAHHTEGKRKFSSWQAQDIIPFDLDGIDLNRIDEYPPLVAKALDIDLNKCAIVYSGNGCHVLVQVKLWRDKEYIKANKLGYRQLLERIASACEEAGLPFDKDSTAWDYARILRLPFTKNKKIKEIDGEKVEVIKEAKLIQNGLEEQELEIPTVVKVKKSLDKGSFPKPDKKEILGECNFFKWLHDYPEEVHEPHAYAMLSITGHFDDDNKTSRDYWNKFSSPSINSKDVTEFTEQALSASGPRTCEGINDIWGKCEGCKYYKKISSPILLKSEDHIGTEHIGFTTTNFTANGSIKSYTRHYDDLLKYFDREYKHKSVGVINKVYLWQGTHYEITDDTFIKHFSHSNFIPLPKAEERREFLSWVKDTNYTKADFLDNDKSRGKVNLANGVLDLATGDLLEHSPDYEFLYCLPFDYNPSATCPRWDEFINDVTLGRECLKNILHEYLGYIISGSNYKYQKALILDGSGNNGKTTFLKVLKKLVGATNISNLSLDSIQSQTFASAGLHGKLVNISEEEPPKTFREQNGVFKNITGDGVVNAQYKYGNPFEFDNKAKIVITYNEMPYLNDTTEGMLRRLLITPWQFDVSKHPEKKDPDIEYRLYEEIEGIFNRALEGWYRLEKQKGFTKSEYVTAKVKAVKSYSDVVYRYFEECVTEEKNSKESFDLMYQHYVSYHDSEGEGGKKLTKNSFGRRLNNLGFDKIRETYNGKRQFMVYGVKLTPHSNRL